MPNIFDGLDGIPVSTPGGAAMGSEQGSTVTSRAGKPIPGIPGYVYGADGYTAVNSGSGDPNFGVSTGSQPAPVATPASAPAATAPATTAPAATSGGSFADQLRQNLQTAYPTKSQDPAWLNHMVDYYTNDVLPRASGDQKYVLDRALGNGNGGADTAEAGPYAGHDFGPDTGSQQSNSSSLGALGNLPVTAPGNFTAPTNTTAAPFSYSTPVPQTQQLQQVTPLTAEQLQNDPAYQFRLQQGIGALQNSAAAKGSVRDPNVWKGLIDYGQNSASQEADKITSRNLALNSANNSAISGNNSTALGAQNQGFNQALGGYSTNLGALGQNYNQAANTWNLNNNAALGWGNLALGNKSADNTYSLGQGNLALGQGNLALNNNQFGLQQQGQYWNQAFNNNAQQWNQYYQLAQLGLPPQ